MNTAPWVLSSAMEWNYSVWGWGKEQTGTPGCGTKAGQLETDEMWQG